MKTAKVFRHGGSQAIRLPKAFRFATAEVLIEKQGDTVVLKPLPAPRFRSFAEVARHLEDRFPTEDAFPDVPPRPRVHERSAPVF